MNGYGSGIMKEFIRKLQSNKYDIIKETMKYLNKETNGITLSRIGLGAMRMADVQQGVDTIHAALDCGFTYLTFMVTEKVNW